MEKVNIDIIDNYLGEWNRDFEGWDFSYLGKYGRMIEFPLSWNYYNEIRRYFEGSKSLLDMGTGGGEFLSELTNLPAKTSATEGYKPNLEIARKHLEPLGIKVYGIEEDDNMPFKDEEFSLIINRHESYSEKEVRRILEKEGYFITQQVGGWNDKELNTLLKASPSAYTKWNLEQSVQQLNKYKFEIIKAEEDKVKTRFYDIGAIIYYLKAIPWQIPDFSVESYHDRLRYIDSLIDKQGYIDITCHRFIIVARKK